MVTLSLSDDFWVDKCASYLSIINELLVLAAFKQNKLFAKRSKCNFSKSRVEYLRHITNGEGVDTDPSKVSAIMSWPVSKNLKELRGFPETEEAFERLKQAMSTVPVLFTSDYNKTFIIETDANNQGIGVVLSQDNRPLAYYSKALAPKHKGKSVYEKEYMVVLEGIDKWRHYVQGNHFIIKIVHFSLKYLIEQEVTTVIQKKGITKLSGLDYKIIYRDEAENRVADALSRILGEQGVEGIGVNYGLLGNNLPPPAQVINLLKSRNIQNIRIFDPNQDVLKALEGSGILLILGTRNEDLQALASDPSFAKNWILTNVIPHASTVKITYISAGNEVIPGPLATFVLGAMQNLDSALKANNLNIPVTTAISLGVLGTSYPPSNGAFSGDAVQFLQPIAQFLATKQYPLLANVYTYFAYSGTPAQIQLDYALLKSTAPIVSDGQFQYNNLFDATVDSLYAALEKVGQSAVEIVVTETGWPSAGDVYATIDNAQTYVNNLVSHVASGQGTPKRPGKVLQTYIFALFNENQKPAGTEENFGLFYPNMTEVYHVNLTPYQN
ncbi:putative glucan endo-1,3-beta-glucosidase GVI [Capsicum annuum]|uniref:Glucan endo-1,3-beta-glucosidase GVI n=1 Tax=Capsicum annuum TaxID=4072 RepID=A0A2G2ZZ87_CAPAN|nr:putative glucan endo-1,3-beta-glucosidase GVI [Capsicum annuum]